MPLGAGESVWRDPLSSRSPVVLPVPIPILVPAPHWTCGHVSAERLSVLAPFSKSADPARRSRSHGSASHGVCSTPAWVPPGNARSATRHATWIPRWSSPWNAPSSWVSCGAHTERQSLHAALCPCAPFVHILHSSPFAASAPFLSLCPTSSAPSLVLCSVRTVLTLRVACPQDSALLDSPVALQECPSRRDRCLQGKWTRRASGVAMRRLVSGYPELSVLMSVADSPHGLLVRNRARAKGCLCGCRRAEEERKGGAHDAHSGWVDPTVFVLYHTPRRGVACAPTSARGVGRRACACMRRDCMDCSAALSEA
jgi:hypothetical protein